MDEDLKSIAKQASEKEIHSLNKQFKNDAKLQKGSSKSKRSMTDVPFLIVFSIVFVVWLSIGTSVIASTNTFIGSDQIPISIGLSSILVLALLTHISIYLVPFIWGTEKGWCGLIIGCIVTAVAMLLGLYTILSPGQGYLVVALITEAYHIIDSMWSIVFVPITSSLLQILLTIFTIAVTLSLTITSHSTDFHDQWAIALMHAFNIIVFLWTTLFISATSKMIVANVAYFKRDKKVAPPHTLRKAISTTLKYHLGSAALGAIMNDICRIPRIIFNIGVKEHRFSRVLCLRWQFLRYFTEYSYAMCAIHGKSLYSSGKSAYQLFKRDTLENQTTLESETAIPFGVCKLAVALSTTSIVYFCSCDMGFFVGLMGFIGVSFTLEMFLNLYSASGDTLILCFREEMDGIVNRPSDRETEILQN